MRGVSLALSLVLVASPVVADDLPVTSRVSAATVYPEGATVTREAVFSAPAGEHELILTDLPRDTPLASVRVAVDGARLGGVRTREDYVPPRQAEDGAEVQAARAEVARLEEALRAGRAEVADIRLEADAARARLRFLDGIGKAEGLAAQDPAALGELVAMIGRETLEARRAEAGAERRADAAERALKDLVDKLSRARQALEALVPETGPRALLAVAIRTDAATEGQITVSYTVPQAGWQPLYDLHLARDEGRVRIERGAFVRQDTGENWRDIALTLSTRRPAQQGAPGEIHPWIPRLGDPDDIRPMPRVKGDGALMEITAPAAATAEADMARPEFDGLSVRYAYPAPVSVATGADRVRLMLSPIEADAEIRARAVPLVDETAFLMARVTNSNEDVILPTSEARFYLDGRYVGQRWLPFAAAGAEMALSFGPIEGLTLKRVVKTRSEGDRGLINRASERRETVEITVENLTGESWPVTLLDRVPVSEEDDLRITWNARPDPDETDVEDKRGILAWRFDLEPGARRTITLDTRMSWPEGKVLR
ncbi:MAG: mucoidy inhibitor MuiA family protein [Roseovarius sp.]